MRQYIGSTLKKALQTYLVILPFAVIGGITVGMYTFEHSAPKVIEAAIEQLGSYQAMMAVTMIQTLIYSLFGWVIGYFIVDRLGLMKSFRFKKSVLVKVCPVIVVLGFAFASDALFFGRWFRKYGIQYAMLGHFGIHLISKIILICVL